ncbi:MAG: 50S ribosomal protein L29 [Bacteroidetes bacterium]|nr:50S ribosomal protein L29 [Bacteroidota bacterium]
MNYKEINKLSVNELNSKLSEERNSLKKLKFSHAISPIDNPLKIRGVRKLIAKIKTSLRSKSLSDSTIKK